MNPWAHIDHLKKKLVADKAAAVKELVGLKFSGDVDSRLEFDGTHWVFPVSGDKVRSRTLEGLIKAVTELKNGTKVKVSVGEMEFTITGATAGGR